MILPEGITGFFERGDQPIPSVDPRQFARACHEVARQTRGGVSDLQAGLAADRNFFSATLIWPDRSRCVLCNALFPYLAFTEGTCDRPDWVFLDDPELAAAFQEYGLFEVLPAEVLSLEPEKEHLKRLPRAELDQIRYWMPHRLGDIIFNRWD